MVSSVSESDEIPDSKCVQRRKQKAEWNRKGDGWYERWMQRRDKNAKGKSIWKKK